MKNTIPIFHVDSFAERPFEGNPAAVCLLRQELPESWMQSISAEMNLPATAFVRPVDAGYELRWFTATGEIMLCGHGTLAAAHVMWTENVVGSDELIRFQTKGGTLTCKNGGGIIELDFPAMLPIETPPQSGLLEALQVQARFVGKTKFDYFLEVESEEIVRSLKPNFEAL